MTAQSDLKKRIRDRQARTGESYAAARAHVMRARAELLGLAPDLTPAPDPSPRQRVEAGVLKVNDQSARVRVFGEDRQLTFRAAVASELAPGQIATLVIERRWSWHGDAYASGKVEGARIDIAKLGLEPLPLEGGELEDVASHSEPFRRPDPYAPLWRKLTAKPRRSFEFDGVAWGALPGLGPDDNPTCNAAALAEAGDHAGAERLLMDALCQDLRCIDAHAHLGNWKFDPSPDRAMIHYEIGIRIGELSLPPDFDGLLVWGQLHNRPFLRCLHGYGLCLWRLRRLSDAGEVFERILSLNPNDNQGVRFCLNDVERGRSWEECEPIDRGLVSREPGSAAFT